MCNCGEIAWIIKDIKQNSIVNFAHYTIKTNDCSNDIWEPIGDLCVNSYSNLFNVKIKDINDLSALNKTVLETHTKIISKNQFMQDWYLLSADKDSNGDALQMANYFFETGLFAASEPDIIKVVISK
jgi:hypothetical protein